MTIFVKKKSLILKIVSVVTLKTFYITFYNDI